MTATIALDLSKPLTIAGLAGSRFELATKGEHGLVGRLFDDDEAASRWLSAQRDGDRYLGLENDNARTRCTALGFSDTS